MYNSIPLALAALQGFCKWQKTCFFREQTADRTSRKLGVWLRLCITSLVQTPPVPYIHFLAGKSFCLWSFSVPRMSHFIEFVFPGLISWLVYTPFHNLLKSSSKRTLEASRIRKRAGSGLVPAGREGQQGGKPVLHHGDTEVH